MPMILDSLYLSVSIVHMDNGQTYASIGRVSGDKEMEELLKTSYSDASSCFEEAMSLIDSVLFTSLVMNLFDKTEGVGG